MARLEINSRYRFGDLVSGDRFAWNGQDYEKLSGTMADLLNAKGDYADPDHPTTFDDDEIVFLYQLY